NEALLMYSTKKGSADRDFVLRVTCRALIEVLGRSVPGFSPKMKHRSVGGSQRRSTSSRSHPCFSPPQQACTQHPPFITSNAQGEGRGTSLRSPDPEGPCRPPY